MGEILARLPNTRGTISRIKPDRFISLEMSRVIKRRAKRRRWIIPANK